jgi:3-oxoacyl-[acyl-carrier protein] reductase
MRMLSGMSVLVTGGGSGIGAGTARHLVAGGARVTICGRRPDKIAAVAKEIGADCRAVVADITQAGDREQAVSAAIEHGGGLDALVNNAGNMLRGNIEELDETELIALFHSNVVGGMLLTGACVPALSERRGAVVFLGSVHTRRAFPGASAYAASKGAVAALTQVLAAELGPREIRVNCVVPGAVFTEINQRAGLFDDAAALDRLEGMASLHALGRIGTEQEVAEAIEYLIRSEWTTGAILDIDGGLGLGVTRNA